jgi:hypothetical protein
VEVGIPWETTMHPGSWDMGEVKYCEKVKIQTDPSLGSHDLLVCGTDTTIAWDWITSPRKGPFVDEKLQTKLALDTDSRIYRVRMKGSWRSARGSEICKCRKTADGLDCEL